MLFDSNLAKNTLSSRLVSIGAFKSEIYKPMIEEDSSRQPTYIYYMHSAYDARDTFTL